MIELLRTRGIKDERLLAAMQKVERHHFVDLPFKNRSYDDSALPIGSQQTISQPYTVAIMTEALAVRPGDKILEIGTGSGYQAAVLVEMGARVFSIERHVSLLNEARKRLEQLKYDIVSKAGDGTLGWKDFSPFDGIIVTAAAPDVPEPLSEQLQEGGRFVIPIGDLNVQDLYVITKIHQKLSSRKITGFKFVPLIGKKGWQ
ncbi:MAG: protein-L-isoaspartate(D-aspartate) O-methyltransferase [Bacteroidetes bacterium]|nr:MAG: protein-L-isoaspartate(D-aspartate) O-methyltransferase [Bacteroidota bacterium]